MCFQGPRGLVSSNGTVLINLVNFYLVNADFSFYFLKFTKINCTPSDPKQKFLFEILNLIRLSEFGPFQRITGNHFFKFSLRMLYSHGYQHSGMIDINF